MAFPVFDLHCDTADRIGWATLDLDLRFTAGTDGYFPGDETHPQDFDLIEGNACAISLAKIGNTPWAQCFATFVPDEIPTAHAARFQAQIMAHMSGQAMLNHDRMVNVRSAADIRPALKGRQGRLHPHYRKRHVLCRGPRADRGAQELGRAHVITQLECAGTARERTRYPRRPHRRRHRGAYADGARRHGA